MIWHRGDLIPDDRLSIGIRDRAFEHGLGLFETFRASDGLVPLLDGHRRRMRRSAEELGLPFVEADFPDREAIRSLSSATEHVGDLIVRVTLSGGLADADRGVLWARAFPAPFPPSPASGIAVSESEIHISPTDPIARHKALNYWTRRLAFERRGPDAEEALLLSTEGAVLEGSRSNLFLFLDDVLTTPALDGPILPGVTRAFVIETARANEIPVTERTIGPEDLRDASEVFLTNAGRGISPVREILGGRLLRPWKLDRDPVRTASLRNLVERRMTEEAATR